MPTICKACPYIWWIFGRLYEEDVFVHFFKSFRKADYSLITWTGCPIMYIRLTIPWIWSESSQSGTRTLQPNCIVFTFPSCSPLLISFLNWPDLVQPKTNPSEIPTRLFAHSTWKLDPIQGLNPPCHDESEQKTPFRSRRSFFLKSFKEFSDTKWKPTLPSLHCHEVYGVH